MKKHLLLLFLVSINFQFFAHTYYVSSNGNDINVGTIAKPFATITKALTFVAAGDSILLVPGKYSINSTINITKSGTADFKIFLLCTNNGRALLDCSSMPFNSSNRGINLKA